MYNPLFPKITNSNHRTATINLATISTSMNFDGTVMEKCMMFPRRDERMPKIKRRPSQKAECGRNRTYPGGYSFRLAFNFKHLRERFSRQEKGQYAPGWKCCSPWVKITNLKSKFSTGFYHCIHLQPKEGRWGEGRWQNLWGLRDWWTGSML